MSPPGGPFLENKAGKNSQMDSSVVPGKSLLSKFKTTRATDYKQDEDRAFHLVLKYFKDGENYLK